MAPNPAARQPSGRAGSAAPCKGQRPRAAGFYVELNRCAVEKASAVMNEF